VSFEGTYGGNSYEFVVNIKNVCNTLVIGREDKKGCKNVDICMIFSKLPIL